MRSLLGSFLGVSKGAGNTMNDTAVYWSEIPFSLISVAALPSVLQSFVIIRMSITVQHLPNSAKIYSSNSSFWH